MALKNKKRLIKCPKCKGAGFHIVAFESVVCKRCYGKGKIDIYNGAR